MEYIVLILSSSLKRHHFLNKFLAALLFIGFLPSIIIPVNAGDSTQCSTHVDPVEVGSLAANFKEIQDFIDNGEFKKLVRYLKANLKANPDKKVVRLIHEKYPDLERLLPVNGKDNTGKEDIMELRKLLGLPLKSNSKLRSSSVANQQMVPLATSQGSSGAWSEKPEVETNGPQPEAIPLVVRESIEKREFKELISYLKANPDKNVVRSIHTKYPDLERLLPVKSKDNAENEDIIKLRELLKAQ